jgi:outer membrane protein assembly factor BamA
MDRYPFPRSGEKVHLSLGGATNRFGGRYSFIKWSGTLGKYFSFLQFHTLFAKISFSMTGKTLPIIERAYIGGAVAETPSEVTSIYNYVPFSGLPPRALIGNKYTIGHGEYRCELKKNLYSIISFDWGPAWDNDKGYSSLAADAPLGIGIGLAYQTFAGPVHLSYGQLIKNSNHYITDNRGFFYFSAGYDF